MPPTSTASTVHTILSRWYQHPASCHLETETRNRGFEKSNQNT